jgi:hypothetical protein
MEKPLSAEELFPLVDRLSPQERLRLLRLISLRPASDDLDAYHTLPPRHDEFLSDADPLAWDADGWEGIACWEKEKMKNSGNEAKKYLKTKDITFSSDANCAHFTRKSAQIER